VPLRQPLRSNTMQQHKSEDRQQRRGCGRRRHAPLNTAWRRSFAALPRLVARGPERAPGARRRRVGRRGGHPRGCGGGDFTPRARPGWPN